MPGGDVKENGCEILKVDRYLSIQLRVLLNKELYGINCKKEVLLPGYIGTMLKHSCEIPHSQLVRRNVRRPQINEHYYKTKES